MKPTMLDQSYYETANEIISRYPLEEKSLIPIIQDIQATYYGAVFRNSLYCLGACGLAPAMMVNEQVHPKMTPEKAAELLKELRAKEEEGRNDDQN